MFVTRGSSLPIISNKIDDLLQLVIDDQLTIYTATQHKEDLIGYLEDNHNIEIDLAAVSEIDSAGLQVLLLVKRESVERSKSVTLSNHSKAVLEVFELLDLSGHFGDPVVIPTEWQQS